MLLPHTGNVDGNATNPDDQPDHLFDHPDRVARSGATDVAFGVGASCQTTAENDGGHLVTRARGLAAGGGQPLLP